MLARRPRQRSKRYAMCFSESRENAQWANPDGRMERQWSKPHQPPTAAIHTGDVGIFATCDKGREGQCVRELNNLFQEVLNAVMLHLSPALSC